MGERPVFRTLDLRKAVPEWVAKGMAVKIAPDGTVEVRAEKAAPSDDADLVNWSRPR
ncbi:hypothetical protein [Paenirhodobacter enshiensis]|uniref:hypothetical protein n=1 Tax=Paenirhodobacter enshiensis TaxID=1105367 RepID=UPI0035B43D64